MRLSFNKGEICSFLPGIYARISNTRTLSNPGIQVRHRAPGRSYVPCSYPDPGSSIPACCYVSYTRVFPYQ